MNATGEFSFLFLNSDAVLTDGYIRRNWKNWHKEKKVQKNLNALQATLGVIVTWSLSPFYDSYDELHSLLTISPIVELDSVKYSSQNVRCLN